MIVLQIETSSGISYDEMQFLEQ